MRRTPLAMHSTKRNAAAEARGVPVTDQLGGKVIWKNSLTSRSVQGRNGGREPRAKGEHLERGIVSRLKKLGSDAGHPAILGFHQAKGDRHGQQHRRALT